MINKQTGHTFSVAIQNGQMFLTDSQPSQQAMAPGQGGMQQPGGMQQQGGALREKLENLLEKRLAPQ